VIVEGTMDDALDAAIEHAIEHCIPVVVRRQGWHLMSVIPDVLLLELLANGASLTGGMLLPRPDGRSVLVV
jgi:hypothetical protein